MPPGTVVTEPRELSVALLHLTEAVHIRAPLRVVGASAAAAGAAVLFGRQGSELAPAVVLAVAAAATGTCVATAWRSSGRLRTSWALLALGSALWCAGHGARPIWETVGPGIPDTVNFGDLAALTSLLFLTVAVALQLVVPSRRVTQLRALTESLMVVGSVLFVSWPLFVRDALDVAEGRPLSEQMLLLAYPVLDILLISTVIFATTRVSDHRPWTGPLLGGVCILTVFGSGLSQVPPSDHRALLGLGAAIGFLVLALAAIRSWPAPTEESPAAADHAKAILLSAPGLALIAVIATTLRQLTGQPVAVELAWITVGPAGAQRRAPPHGHLREPGPQRRVGPRPRRGDPRFDAEVVLPRQHEPRDPHPDERRDRPHRPAARHRPRRRAAGAGGRRGDVGRGPARPDRRHPRLLQDRGPEAGARGDRPRPRGPARRGGDHRRRRRPPEGHRARSPTASRVSSPSGGAIPSGSARSCSTLPPTR